jgi:hypothetical protein
VVCSRLTPFRKYAVHRSVQTCSGTNGIDQEARKAKSETGQKQTFWRSRMMSALPPDTGHGRPPADVRRATSGLMHCARPEETHVSRSHWPSGLGAEPLARSDRAPENDTWPGHGRGDDLGVVGFFRDALVERLLCAPQAARAPFIRRRIARRRSPRMLHNSQVFPAWVCAQPAF